MTESTPTRRRRRTKEEPAPTVAAGATDLVSAVQWIKTAQTTGENKPEFTTHCLFYNGWLLATDGLLTMGCRVSGFDGVVMSPDTHKFLSALLRVGENLKITYNDGNGPGTPNLVINSKTFDAVIPCSSQIMTDIAGLAPDNGQSQCDDKLLEAMRRVLPLTKGTLNTPVLEGSIFIGQGLAVATDRRLACACEHGFRTPEMIVPREFAAALSSATESTWIGAAPDLSTLTIWFSDSRFAKTRLYARTEWPDIADVSSLFDAQAETSNGYTKITNPMRHALDATIPHSPNGVVWFDKHKIRAGDLSGAPPAEHTFPNSGLEGSCFDGSRLRRAFALFDEVNWHSMELAYFKGERIRGAIVTAN